MRTLDELQTLQETVRELEYEAKQATVMSKLLRECGGYTDIIHWYHELYDHDNVKRLLSDAIREFGPTILGVLAARQEVLAHEAMTQEELKRAELGAFVKLEPAEGGTA